MHALILAGGKGTRLRPLTVYTPKPIVPVLNRPFLLFQIEILRRAGITDITLSLSYQPDKIAQVLGDGTDYGVNLNFITEPSPMGTAGAYRHAAEAFAGPTLVLNGDILSDLDVRRIIEFHQSKRAEATIALARVADTKNYGLVETAGDGSVLRFIEKPSHDESAEVGVNTINAGIYIFEPSIVEMIPNGENRSFEYHVFPDLLASERSFFGFTIEDNYWRDIGNPQSYLAAHHDFLAGRIKGFEAAASGDSDVATAANIDKSSIIGEGCVIKPNSRIVNSVIGPGVHIEEKAVVENSVIWSHTRVSSAAEVRDAVIGRSCHIGRNVSVTGGTVLGDKATLPDYSRV
jgi:NDP-sugar pyrophosphorylase family protein